MNFKEAINKGSKILKFNNIKSFILDSEILLSSSLKLDRSKLILNLDKKIKDKENGRATDEALKLIVKISEGSVRDALSLLDRALLSLDDGKELDLNSAQKIFGYFDKSQLISTSVKN